mmetsp:Transcript_4925/g.8885  ORF Transcript_4925/g.8885 Transcript_4925/m.8885 type:complete len:90 (+) Transcript_4925:566-835(+)
MVVSQPSGSLGCPCQSSASMERETGCPPPMKRRGVFVAAAVNEFPDDEGRRRTLRRLLEPRVTKLRERDAKDMVGNFFLLNGYQPSCLT